MTTQAGLFDPPLARASDPETSHAAAEDAKLSASRGHLFVMDALYCRGPMTDFELADYTGWPQTSIGKRRLECQRAGLVDPTPYRRTTPSGSKAIVWRASAAGETWFREQSG